MTASGTATDLLAHNFNLETTDFLTQFRISPGQSFLAQSFLHELAREDDVLTAELLLDEGVSLTAPDAEGNHPLHEAARHGSLNMLAFLLDHGAGIEARLPACGHTPLYLAARHGHEDAVRLLLARGANPNTRDWMSGQTPLHLAATCGRLSMAGALIAHGADVRDEDTMGRTPRDYAAKAGFPEMEKTLLKVMTHRTRG